MRYGCCEADLGAQRRDHEGTNERRPVFILRRSSYRSGTSFVLTSLRRRRHRGRFAGSFGTLRVDFDLVDGVGERGVGEARRAAGGRGRRSVSYRFRVSFLSDTYLMYCDVSAHLQSLTLTRKLSSGYLAPYSRPVGPPSLLSSSHEEVAKAATVHGGRISGRMDLLTLSSQS